MPGFFREACCCSSRRLQVWPKAFEEKLTPILQFETIWPRSSGAAVTDAPAGVGFRLAQKTSRRLEITGLLAP
jgi:hypothetical protein